MNFRKNDLDEKIKNEQLFDAYKIAKAIYNQKEDSDILYQLGMLCIRTGKIEEAKQHFTNYISKGGKNSFAYLNLGHAHKASGNFDLAENAYQKFIEKNPKDAGHGYWHLSDLKDIKAKDKDIRQLSDLILDPTTSPTNKMLMHFSLGNHLERRKEFGEAFKNLRKANELQRQKKPFNRASFTTLINSLLSVVRINQFSFQDTNPRPIFILGLPRSGSTLCEQILASHSKITATDELPFLSQIAIKIEKSGNYSKALYEIRKEDATLLRKKYFDDSGHYRENQQLSFIDKNPLNFFHIALIKTLFPDAIIINTYRNALDNAISLYKRYFFNGHEYTYNLSDIAYFMEGYLRLIRHWDTIFPESIFHLKYESLVENKSTTIKALINLCSLPFEENCMQHHKNGLNVLTPSADQVTKPIYKSAIETGSKYKEYMELNSALALIEIDQKFTKSFGKANTLARPSAWTSYWKDDTKSMFLTDKKTQLTEYWAEAARSSKAKNVLDLCCGNGMVLELLASNTANSTDIKLVGVDSAKLTKTSDKYKLISNVDICSLPFNDNEFDLITSQFGIEYSDLDRSIQEAARVCSENGVLKFVCHSSDSFILKDNRIIHKCSEALLNDIFPLFMGMLRGLDLASKGSSNGELIAAKFREDFNVAIGEIHSTYGNALFNTGFPEATREVLKFKSTGRMCLIFDDFKIELEQAQIRLQHLFNAALDDTRKHTITENLKTSGFEVYSTREIEEDSNGVIGSLIEARLRNQ